MVHILVSPTSNPGGSESVGCAGEKHPDKMRTHVLSYVRTSAYCIYSTSTSTSTSTAVLVLVLVRRYDRKYCTSTSTKY